VLINEGVSVNRIVGQFSPLTMACAYGRLDTAVMLIKENADINAMAGDNSPLIAACMSGNTELVQILIAKGANIDAMGYYYSSLTMACFLGHLDIAKMLIEHGANVDEVVNGKSALQMMAEKNNSVMTQFMQDAKSLKKALSKEQYELAKILAEKNIEINNITADELKQVVFKKQYDLAKTLVDKGVAIDGISSAGLKQVLADKQYDLAKALIGKGAPIESVDSAGLKQVLADKQYELAKVLINKSLEAKSIGINEVKQLVEWSAHDLKDIKKGISVAREKLLSIKPEDYPYTEVVKKSVKVKEKIIKTKIQNVNETRYGGANYERVLNAAKKKVADAQSREKLCKSKLDTAAQAETQANNEMTTANTNYNNAQSTLTSYQNSLSSVSNTVYYAQQTKDSIKPEHYPYTAEVERWVSTRELFKSGKWKTFWETRYGGAAYENAMKDASKKLEDAKNNQASWQSWVNGASSALSSANTGWYAADKKLKDAQNLVTNLKSDWENAKNSLVSAQQEEGAININNYAYTVVVQKPVEVEELVEVTKLQDFNETRYGGAEYDKAIAKAKEDLVVAQNNGEQCQKTLDLLMQEEATLRQEIEIQQKAEQAHIAGLEQNLIDGFQIIDEDGLNADLGHQANEYEREFMGN
jgi:cytohesin